MKKISVLITAFLFVLMFSMPSFAGTSYGNSNGTSWGWSQGSLGNSNSWGIGSGYNGESWGWSESEDDGSSSSWGWSESLDNGNHSSSSGTARSLTGGWSNGSSTSNGNGHSSGSSYGNNDESGNWSSSEGYSSDKNGNESYNKSQGSSGHSSGTSSSKGESTSTGNEKNSKNTSTFHDTKSKSTNQGVNHSDDNYSNNIYIDGEKVYFVSPPVVKNDRLLVPIRTITNYLGVYVNWDGENQTAVIFCDDVTIHLTIGEKTALVDGKKVRLDESAQIINGYTYVPLRFIAETMGAEVEYDKETGDINIDF